MMIVQCKLTYPTPEDLEALGASFFRERDFHVSPGKEYLVLGLAFTIDSPLLGTGTSVLIETDFGHPADVPLCLFDIVDGRASRFWDAKSVQTGWLALSPRSFYRDHYFEDLDEGLPEVKKDYERVVGYLKEEPGYQGRVALKVHDSPS